MFLVTDNVQRSLKRLKGCSWSLMMCNLGDWQVTGFLCSSNSLHSKVLHSKVCNPVAKASQFLEEPRLALCGILALTL